MVDEPQVAESLEERRLVVTKKLYRSRNNRMIAGVAGGLAEYFETDPVIVRLIFILLLLAHGLGFWVYVVGWIIIPEELQLGESKNSKKNKAEPGEDSSSRSTNLGEQLETNAKRVAQDIESVAKKIDDKTGGRYLIGLILIILGLLFLFDNLLPAIDWAAFWPVILVLIGLWLVVKNFHKEQR